jgi:TRAP-type mannitol/chloroaromatic compound transport system permease small subunit
MALLRALDRLIGRIVAIAQWLALPLVVLLFLQWPLRDLIHCCSREANDLGQWIFAIFVAVSMTAATRAGTHLSADLLALRYSPRTRALFHRAGMAFGLVP